MRLLSDSLYNRLSITAVFGHSLTYEIFVLLSDALIFKH